MNEWQPARFRRVHSTRDIGCGPALTDEEVRRMPVIYVRPKEFSKNSIEKYYRSRGCDADRFYEVRPDDPTLGNMACEHEVLTD